MQEHFYALERCGDDGHGDGAEEAGGGDLCDAELVVFDFGHAGDELLAEIVTPKGYGDWRMSADVLVQLPHTLLFKGTHTWA